jgi:hypothetical protein
MIRFENDDLGYLARTEGVLFQALRNCANTNMSAAAIAAPNAPAILSRSIKSPQKT